MRSMGTAFASPGPVTRRRLLFPATFRSLVSIPSQLPLIIFFEFECIRLPSAPVNL